MEGLSSAAEQLQRLASRQDFAGDPFRELGTIFEFEHVISPLYQDYDQRDNADYKRYYADRCRYLLAVHTLSSFVLY
jgi:hypothetical protein